MDFLKGIGGKIAAGVVTLAVIAAGISWWQMSPATRSGIEVDAGRLIGWMLVVLCLPWVSFALVGWVAKMDSNRAGAALVTAITAAEAALLGWLYGFSGHGRPAWTMFVAGVLVAGVYNLFACDWIAEKVS